MMIDRRLHEATTMKDDFAKLDVPMQDFGIQPSDKTKTDMRKRLKSLAETQGYLKSELEQSKLDMLYQEQQKSKRLDNQDRSEEFKTDLIKL